MADIRLSNLVKGDEALIINIEGDQAERFLKMGFLEGTQISVLHEAPFGKDPMAIRVRDSIIAVRRHEAQQVVVKRVSRG